MFSAFYKTEYSTKRKLNENIDYTPQITYSVNLQS